MVSFSSIGPDYHSYNHFLPESVKILFLDSSSKKVINVALLLQSKYNQICLMEQHLIGIRREDKSVWERRTPLIPADVKIILEKYPHLKIKVQPSQKRIFSDAEYQSHGAILDEDISDCSLILGIKEIPIHNMIADKTFVYFSHTFKVSYI